MENTKKKIAAIVTFLGDQQATGELDEEQVDSLNEVIQRLETVYGVSAHDGNHTTSSDLQEELSPFFTACGLEAAGSDLSCSPFPEPSPEDIEEAETLKNFGNEFMKREKFSDALDCYTEAIQKDGQNAVYFCNRAAAYSKLKKHQKAVEDCKSALAIDPAFSKAYCRMGVAYVELGNHKSAIASYRRALELDPDNQSYLTNLQIAEQKHREAAAKTDGETKTQDTSGFWGGTMRSVQDFLAMLAHPSEFLCRLTSIACDPQTPEVLSGLQSGDLETKLYSLMQMPDTAAAGDDTTAPRTSFTLPTTAPRYSDLMFFANLFALVAFCYRWIDTVVDTLQSAQPSSHSED
ncbi:small glutamine-rich tetratricopeptide repeat-containing protein alpha-like isoform X2 [Babylonia areolata]|uniref:small glutamine-rich tetratricopeptide repeat-containing protein alpha-like isoform X2 n=1 Tax=Babylonia areolata TaxID=304850 RepID=UPI003FD610DF